MTYRKFTALARRVREEATPCVDIDRLKADEFSTSRSTDERTCRMRWNVAAVAMAACVAVLACVVLTRFRPLSPASPTSDPVGSVPSSD
ncbi:MAG: hypothetical protein IIW40_00280, partial [Clostridia bacterium]|nr:hypothetical protein [Clostridia bacterium]